MSFHYFFGVVNPDYARLTSAERTNLHVTLSAYRSFQGRRREHIAYVSMPISTGWRYYQVMSEYDAKTAAQLDQKLGVGAFERLVMQPNIEEGTAFANAIGQDSQLLCVSPSVFDARPWQWGQRDYMALWYLVIGELSGRHFLSDRWEYTLGGVREILLTFFLQWGGITYSNLPLVKKHWGLRSFDHCATAAEIRDELDVIRRIRAYDSHHQEIRIDVALARCVDALYDIRKRGFSTDELVKVVWIMKQIPILSGLEGTKDAPYDPLTDVYQDARDRLHDFLGFPGY